MLGSVMYTALSGMRAAEFGLGVTAHNVANQMTDGFKASRPVFAEQPPATSSTGSPPSSTSGGRNPLQIGQGVYVSAITTDTTPGPYVLANGSSSAANSATTTNASSTAATPSAANLIELSNTDIGREIVNLSLYRNMFRANVRVLDTGNQLLAELFSLRRL